MNRPVRAPRRAVHGVLLLDKSIGLSSNDALMRAKRLFNAQKAGHTGTLDPLATGLLPLCFGEATKFSQDLLDAPKRYEARVALGATTTTGDAEGEVLDTRAVAVTTADVVALLPRFTGALSQVPPMYSALKRDGRPLYEYARAGITLEREPRTITIHALDLIESTLPAGVELTLRVACSKGTYIRTLAQDIGAALGCGAHLAGLRRTAVGELDLSSAVTLAQLEALDDGARAALLHPVDALLATFPAVQLTEEATGRFKHGQRLSLDPATFLPPVAGVAVKLEPGTAGDPIPVGAGELDLTSAGERELAGAGEHGLAGTRGRDPAAVTDVKEAKAHAPLRVRVYDAAGRFLGTAHCVAQVLVPERLVASDLPSSLSPAV